MSTDAAGPWPWVREQRRTDAGLRLVGRALLEGMAAGAVLGAAVLLAPLLAGLALAPGGAREAGLEPGYVLLVVAVAAAVGTGLGLAGAVCVLVVLGVVVRLDPRSWPASCAAWLAPAVAVTAATLVLGLVTDVGWFLGAAAPAGVVTAWRARRALAGFRAAVAA
ncbi:hypothetical protein [Aquipuribacter sp. SD81]|uniref:hypothetical protein n=1 Tax=Aquipuribacter sp. SD81 TaxID=3127703 RepID=UPI0030180204